MNIGYSDLSVEFNEHIEKLFEQTLHLQPEFNPSKHLEITEQDRELRAVVIKLLLRELGTKAIQLSTTENSTLLYFGDVLLQFHKQFVVALKDFGAYRALNALSISMFIATDQRASKLGIEGTLLGIYMGVSPTSLETETRAKIQKLMQEYLLTACKSKDEKIIGEAIALPYFTMFVSDALCSKDFYFEEFKARLTKIMSALRHPFDGLFDRDDIQI